jgi:hypothetical protein
LVLNPHQGLMFRSQVDSDLLASDSAVRNLLRPDEGLHNASSDTAHRRSAATRIDRRIPELRV